MLFFDKKIQRKILKGEKSEKKSRKKIFEGRKFFLTENFFQEKFWRDKKIKEKSGERKISRI